MRLITIFMLVFGMASVAWASPDTDLVDAAKSGDMAAVDAALAAGASPDAAIERGATALMMAAAYNRPEVVKKLIAAGADVERSHPNRNDATALMFASSAADANMVRLLLKHGAKVDTRDKKGDPAINWAVYSGRPAIVQVLLDANADTSLTGHGNAMQIALRRGNEGTLAVLIAKEQAPERDSGEIALEAAVLADDAVAVKALAEHVNVEAAQDWAGRPVLHAAARANAAKALQALLDAGAEVDGRDAVGQTALMVAARQKSSEAAGMLLQAGAEVNAHADAHALNLTPMHYAGIGGDADIVAMLAKAGAKPDAKGREKGTPFSWAWGEGQVDAAIAIIKAGADPDAEVPYGGTPRSLMAGSGSETAKAFAESLPAKSVDEGNQR